MSGNPANGEGGVKGRRICLLITGLARAGAETQLFRLAIGLKSRGWEVLVVSITPPEAYRDELTAAGVALVDLGIPRGKADLRMVPRLLRHLKSYRPDVLTSFMFHANLLGRLAGLLARVPVVVSSIRNEYFGGSVRRSDALAVRLREGIVRLTGPLARITTTNSSTTAASLVRRGIVPQRKMAVVPNGIDVERFATNPSVRKRVRRELGAVSGELIWLNVGRLETQKDQQTLLRAFARHSVDAPASRLWIAGDGFLRADLASLAIDLGIAHLVQFLGRRSDVPDLLQGADAFVLSSAWEGLPNVLLEAHASALPAVSTNVGGVKEVVSSEISGYLVPGGDVDKLASAMTRLALVSTEDRHAMGEAGRAHVVEHFSQEAVTGQWESLFLQLLESRNRARLNRK